MKYLSKDIILPNYYRTSILYTILNLTMSDKSAETFCKGHESDLEEVCEISKVS